MKMNITTLQTFDTEYSADSVEWCPHPKFLQYFVCGTYELLEGDKNKNSATNLNASHSNNSDSPPMEVRHKGRIYLYKFDKKNRTAIEMQRVETCAILDIKWMPDSNEKVLLATATVLGRIEIFLFTKEKLVKTISVCLNVQNRFKKLVALSVDWDKKDNSSTSNDRRLLATNSKGEISLLEYTDTGNLLSKHTWTAHKYESWTAAFNKWDSNQVFTGGDDAILKAYDLRTFSETCANKSHIAGVTSLLSHPRKEYTLLSGSYDERLRIFDTRNMKIPRKEIKLNGGIWRIKEDPMERDLLLIACMYQNFSVVELSENSDTPNLNIVGIYNEHKSICYGADWCRDIENNDDNLIMATCSFYDHKLCLSQLSNNTLTI